MAKAPTDLRSLARSHTVRAIEVLSGLMNGPEVPPPTRAVAAMALLDRGWGKPHQAMTIEHSQLNELNDDELANLIALARSAFTSPAGIGSGTEAQGRPN